MKALFPFVGLLIAGFFASTIHSQTYNFESYSNGSSLSSQPGWTSSDLNQADGVENLQSAFFPGTSGANVGIIGGFWEDSGSLITPSNRVNLLTAPVTAASSTDYPFLRFRWIQNISNTDQDNGKRDRFGWTVRSGSTSLLSLISDPLSSTSNILRVRGYNSETSSSHLVAPSNVDLNRGEAYAFEILVNPTSWTWSAKVSGNFTADYESISDWSTIIQNAAMGGTTGSTIDGFAATWITQDSNPANAGRNVMAFDNINIVPEPSTVSLVTLGSLALLASRRQRSA